MKLVVTDENYCCTIVKIQHLNKLDNLDNLRAVSFYGYQALVSKDCQVGQLGFLFTAETELSEDFCAENNLFRDGEKNKNKQPGYIDNNRRVRTIKFRGNISSALFIPVKDGNFKEGDKFNSIDGVEICKKYEPKLSTPQKQRDKTGVKINIKSFPEHFDTANYWKNIDLIKPDDYIYVTQKLHGTSIRCSYQEVGIKLTWWQKILKKFGFAVKEKELLCIAGSRRCIFPVKKENVNNKLNLYERFALEILHLIPKNWVIFGEIIGQEDAPIFKGYEYEHEKNEASIYIYRISVVNDDGVSVDLSFPQMANWCVQNGLKHVPLLWEGLHSSFQVDDFMDISYSSTYKNAVPNSGTVDEGVCVRVDGGRLQPLILKAKSPLFLEKETKSLDQNLVQPE